MTDSVRNQPRNAPRNTRRNQQGGEIIAFRGTSAARLHRCPCCGCRTLRQRGRLELCPVCAWADAGQDERDADTVHGGPNGELSLRGARANYRRFGASAAQFMDRVRKPQPEEL
jgi:hypothetical protein